MTHNPEATETEEPGWNIMAVTDADLYLDVQEKVDDGLLPHDTFLRLGCVGHLEQDDDGESIMRKMLTDLNDNYADTDALHPDTRALFFGELPPALLDWNGPVFEKYTRSQSQMYYRKGNLVDVIERRRQVEGKTIDEPLMDRRLRREISVCRSLAHGVWRALVREAHPEWLDDQNMERYYQPAMNTVSITFDMEPELMRRRIVSVAVLSDELVRSMYERATATGIKGIGKVGLTDIRSMLAEEHPELL